MIIYYSAFTYPKVAAEFAERHETNMMITYFDMHKKNQPNKQLAGIIQERKKNIRSGGSRGHKPRRTSTANGVSRRRTRSKRNY